MVLVRCYMNLLGVAVLELNCHPDHNNGPIDPSHRSLILAILQQTNNPLIARLLHGVNTFTKPTEEIGTLSVLFTLNGHYIQSSPSFQEMHIYFKMSFTCFTKICV